MFKRILVPTDGSDITVKAVDTGISLARTLNAELFVISVKEPFLYTAISELQPAPTQDYLDAQEKISSERTSQVARLCQVAGVACQACTVEALNPWEAIIEYAETMKCDLVVMASHGRGGVSALLLGSQTQKILSHSKLPVLVVR